MGNHCHPPPFAEERNRLDPAREYSGSFSVFIRERTMEWKQRIFCGILIVLWSVVVTRPANGQLFFLAYYDVRVEASRYFPGGINWPMDSKKILFERSYLFWKNTDYKNDDLIDNQFRLMMCSDQGGLMEIKIRDRETEWICFQGPVTKCVQVRVDFLGDNKAHYALEINITKGQFGSFR
jgi:hypothetical protein